MSILCWEDHYSRDPVQVQSFKHFPHTGDRLWMLVMMAIHGMLDAQLLSQHHTHRCTGLQHKLLIDIGAQGPAKIQRFTLMCPIHGNL